MSANTSPLARLAADFVAFNRTNPGISPDVWMNLPATVSLLAALGADQLSVVNQLLPYRQRPDEMAHLLAEVLEVADELDGVERPGVNEALAAAGTKPGGLPPPRLMAALTKRQVMRVNNALAQRVGGAVPVKARPADLSASGHWATRYLMVAERAAARAVLERSGGVDRR